MGVKLYLLSGGTLDIDRAVIFPTDDSHRHVTIPVPQILIESGGKHILFDTGMPPEAAGDSNGLKRAYDIDTDWIKPFMSVEQRVDGQLASLGLHPSDLDLVVNTHVHFDHAGGNALLAGIPIAVQRSELESVQGETGWWDAPGVEFQVVEGDWSPAPGVEMLHTPGHTPGHQSMLVRLGAQPWLFTWDAVYTEEHWRTGKLGAVVDVPAARASIERLRSIATAENAHIIFGHDIGQWSALGMTDRPKLIAEAP
jgi:N-acyl homoserine lactone hydrolase